MNDLLRKISVRTLTRLVIAAVALLVLAVGLFAYQIFAPETAPNKTPRFATNTPLPSVTPSAKPDAPPSLTPQMGTAPATQIFTPAPTASSQPALSGQHPPIEPTNQPCENCHQDLRNGN